MTTKTLLTIPILMILSFFSSKTDEQKFWEWFQKNEKRYYENVDDIQKREILFDELLEELHKVHPELTFEISPKNEEGIRDLTISADGMKEYFPAVTKLVEFAPAISNWKVYAFRQRIPGEDLKIDYDDFSIAYSDIFFRYGNEGEKIGLELHIRNFDESARIKNAIYILLDSLIGEYDTETKIDWIDWKKLDESDTSILFEFYELRELVDSKKTE